jgi:phosphoglycerate dehydrogenase-like enzyme
MILAFTRKLHVYVRNQQEKKWHHANLGSEMHGKTIGILGIGAIGSETARLAKAFGMKTLGLRRKAIPHESVDRMFDPSELHDLLSHCDYVVNTLPLTDETSHIIGREAFTFMKTDAFYVNIGRGRTTDTAALIDALASGRIAGAGLDVFEIEPLPAESLLWDMENVIITPHSSGSTSQYDNRVVDIFLENLQSYLQVGAPVRNLVDLDMQY